MKGAKGRHTIMAIHAQSVNAVGVLSVRQNIVPKTSPRISSGIPSSLSICSEIGARKRSPSGDGSLCSKEDRSISSKTPKIHISVCGRALFACSNGQLRELESLVKENPELINYQYPYCYCCYSCMHIAAKSGNLDIVHFLVKNGANLNAKDNWSTPLHLAAQAGHLEVTRQLKEMGADTSVLDAHGKRYCDYLPADNRRSHMKNSALKKLKTHNSKHNNGQNEDTHSVSSNQSQLSLISYNSLHNRFGTLRPIGRAVSDFLHRK
uniref:ANK_REP_REGION domain-containing protein n=1 Tax=Globodera pallida TaxID=36090 RepID=A0A183CFJ3_GLOPA